MNPPIDQYSFTIGSIANNILYVNCGAKPVSLAQVHNSYLKYCIDEINDNKLFYIVDKNCSTHTDLYLYKEKYLTHIINYVIGKSYKKDIFMDWVLGKLFGYSDESIGEYIDEKVNRKVIRWR